jgi:hypothetical protein
VPGILRDGPTGRDGSLDMKSLNGVADVAAWSALAVGGAAHAQEAVQWRVEDGGNGHWYSIDTEEREWLDAKLAAEASGGTLATFTSAAEWGRVADFIAVHSTTPWVWLGGYLNCEGAPAPSCPDCVWQWVDDDAPWQFDAWGAGEPNCYNVVERLATNGIAWVDLGSPGFGLLYESVREFSADCNGDGIVDYGQIVDGTFADANGNGVPDCCDDGVSCDPCVGDVNFDGIVNGADISVLLGFWGLNGKPVAADINQDGQVDGTDLANVLGSWGECP